MYLKGGEALLAMRTPSRGQLHLLHVTPRRIKATDEAACDEPSDGASIEGPRHVGIRCNTIDQ